MAARNGMTAIITRLRNMTQAGTADYTVAGSAYWSDDQLEDVLDRYATLYRQIKLQSFVLNENGTAVYYDYAAPSAIYEQATSGAQYWQITDSLGSAVGTANYSVDYNTGNIRFSADTEGTAYYLTARAYDLNSAAAEIWETKAGQVWDAYDFDADGQQFSRSQMHKHALEQARFFRAQNGATIRRMVRGDLR